MTPTIDMDSPPPRYTSDQVARSARADAETNDEFYLFKAVSVLHATYQIRLLAFLAAMEGKTLLIEVPKRCRKGKTLLALAAEHPDLIRVEKVD